MNREKLFNSTILQIWGKTNPFHPLLYHMVDVGHIGQELINSTVFNSIKYQLMKNLDCSESILKSWLGYILSHHDIGKCHPEFQNKAPDLAEDLKAKGLIFQEESFQQYSHALYGGNWIKKHLKTLSWGKKAYITISSSILGHHGRFHVKFTEDHPKIHENWEPYRQKISKLLYNYFKPEEWRPKDFKDHSNIGVLLVAIQVLSDWIASNENFLHILREKLDKNENNITGFKEYCNKSKKWARSIITSLGFNYFHDTSSIHSISDIWPEFRDLTSVQRLCEKNFSETLENSLIIIEAPMGTGKTEAALYLSTRFMKKWKGIYFALPTMATSNQMFNRVRGFLSKFSPNIENNLQLIHGMAWMIDKFSGESRNFEDIPYDWFKPKKRALLAPFGVGTIDQCLMSGLWVKFGFLRLLGLAEKILIIDEVHAYDAYMTTILTKVLNWAYTLEIPVIILSATLPLSKKKDLLNSYSRDHNICKDFPIEKNKYPLITVKEEDNIIHYFSENDTNFTSSTKKIKIVLEIGLLEDFEHIADIAINSALQDKCTCVIMNSVKNSQNLFKIIEKKCSQQNYDLILTLFHARFPIKRRIEIEEEVLKYYDKESKDIELTDPCNTRPKKSILVATQVVEQSLDLDFDEMISEIAPIDLLIQRMGRMHRHHRKFRPCGDKAIFRVLLPSIPFKDLSFGITGKIYHQNILIRTLDVLLNRKKGKSNFNIFIFPSDIRTYIDKVYCEGNYQLHELNEFQDIFNKSYDTMKQALEIEENEAKIYLIPPPNPKRFEFLGRDSSPFSEGDSQANSFFYAKTRIGERSLNAILLEDSTLESYIHLDTPPNHEIQKKIMENSVSLPKYWFNNTREDFPIIKWLSHSLIVRLKNNCLEYELEKYPKKKRRLINHQIYGVYMEES